MGPHHVLLLGFFVAAAVGSENGTTLVPTVLPTPMPTPVPSPLLFTTTTTTSSRQRWFTVRTALLCLCGILIFLPVVAEPPMRTREIKTDDVPGKVAVFVPCYRETEDEIRNTCLSFSRAVIQSDVVRTRLEIFFILDNTVESPTYAAMVSYLKVIAIEDDQRFHCHRLDGDLFGIPCHLQCRNQV